MSIEAETVGLVFVEGRDDRDFLRVLIQQMGLEKPLQLILLEGKDRNQLKRRLQVIQSDPLFDQLQTIGIIRDADQFPERAKQSIEGVLDELRLSVPVSIFIMPPQQEGTGQMLEDLLWEYFQQENDPALGCVDDYIACLQNIAPDYVKPHRIPKARFYALLASKKDPTEEAESLLAFKRHIKNWDSVVFDPLKSFLVKLAPA